MGEGQGGALGKTGQLRGRQGLHGLEESGGFMEEVPFDSHWG